MGGVFHAVMVKFFSDYCKLLRKSFFCAGEFVRGYHERLLGRTVVSSCHHERQEVAGSFKCIIFMFFMIF